MNLDGSVALVTGAQEGIGAACAELLASRGATVVVNYLDDLPAAEALHARVERAGGRAVLCQGNVAQPDDVARMVAVAESAGGLNVLVNNAGIFPRVPFLDMTDEEWDTVLNVNLRGAFLCSRAACRVMVDSGRGGSIVNLSSAAAHSGPPLGVHYASTKAGLIGFTRSLAVAVGEHGIRVNAVAPGLTDTAQPRYGMTEEEIAQAGARLPLQRIATPQDIARTIAFLASDEARHVTGQVLHVNGGQLFA